MRHPLRKRPGQKGFSIVEALVAMFILSFGLLAIIAMLDTSFGASVYSRDHTRAMELAACMIDTIRQQVMTNEGVDDDRLITFDNDGTTNLVLDTASATVPAFEPGKTEYNQWKSLIANSGLIAGRGIVTIVAQDTNFANNTYLEVEVRWSSTGKLTGLLSRGVTLRTVLYQ